MTDRCGYEVLAANLHQLAFERGLTLDDIVGAVGILAAALASTMACVGPVGRGAAALVIPVACTTKSEDETSNLAAERQQLENELNEEAISRSGKR